MSAVFGGLISLGGRPWEAARPGTGPVQAGPTPSGTEIGGWGSGGQARVEESLQPTLGGYGGRARGGGQRRQVTENTNRVGLGRESGGRPPTGGPGEGGRSSAPVPAGRPASLLRWPRPPGPAPRWPPPWAPRHRVSALGASRPAPFSKWRPRAAGVLNMVPSVLVWSQNGCPVLANWIAPRTHPGAWQPTPQTRGRRAGAAARGRGAASSARRAPAGPSSFSSFPNGGPQDASASPQAHLPTAPQAFPKPLPSRRKLGGPGQGRGRQPQDAAPQGLSRLPQSGDAPFFGEA